MEGRIPVLLLFSSNLTQYELTVYDGCHAVKRRVNGREGCLRLCTRSPYLRVVATPRTAGYSTLLYFFVDTTCQKTVTLYFFFPAQPVTPTPPLVTNTFTLTDRNYGLPIDGTLFFTAT